MDDTKVRVELPLVSILYGLSSEELVIHTTVGPLIPEASAKVVGILNGDRLTLSLQHVGEGKYQIVAGSDTILVCYAFFFGTLRLSTSDQKYDGKSIFDFTSDEMSGLMQINVDIIVIPQDQKAFIPPVRETNAIDYFKYGELQAVH